MSHACSKSEYGKSSLEESFLYRTPERITVRKSIIQQIFKYFPHFKSQSYFVDIGTSSLIRGDILHNIVKPFKCKYDVLDKIQRKELATSKYIVSLRERNTYSFHTFHIHFVLTELFQENNENIHSIRIYVFFNFILSYRLRDSSSSFNCSTL